MRELDRKLRSSQRAGKLPARNICDASARKFAREAPGVLRHADDAQGLFDALRDEVFRRAARLEAEGDVLGNAHMGKESVNELLTAGERRTRILLGAFKKALPSARKW